ncbi:hypothetical protein DRW07_02515 [Alteromonas sediminis]|uniref:Type II secretion system protein GspC N-terminal domain-containing protein n=1 Tax=Alteromonas sediminis TaxID=2259342 RepID=A0A3N5YA34_9ALTE|nr:hypothetical protein [Alteromonas sediminis]RPJ68299.1 hypothetical protein DRW07_02515 [Alteromonas sediminis]
MSFRALFSMQWMVLVAAVGLVSATAAWVTQTPSTDAIALESRDGTWQSASFGYKQASGNTMKQIDMNALWGLTPKKDVEATASTPWALKGIIEDNGRKVAIIDVDIAAKSNTQDRYQRFLEGDTLPDGAVLVKINKSQVEFTKNGTSSVKRFFEQQ